jgi:outer membrane protein assembly factor BamB
MKKKLILFSTISDFRLTIFFILVSLCVIPVQAVIVPQYNGTIVWNKHINGMYSVSLSNDGSLAFATFGGLSLLDSSGNIIWTREPSGDNKIVWSVAISDDGRYIVMGCNNDNAYLYDRPGSLVWECQTAVLGLGGDEINGVGLSSDGSYIVLGDSKGDIHFLNADGQRLWKYSTDEKIPVGGLGISGDGRYIAAVGDFSNNVYLLNDAGTLLWKREYTKDQFSLEPRGLAISGDGKYIVVGSTDNNVYFLNNQGNLLWKYNTRNDIRSVAISESGSFVVVGSAYDTIYLFNKEGKPLWYYPTGGQNGGVAITKDGRLIAGNNNDQGNVFVLTNPNYLPQGIPPQTSGSSTGNSTGNATIDPSNGRQKENDKPVSALTLVTQISIIVFLLVVALLLIRYLKKIR